MCELKEMNLKTENVNFPKSWGMPYSGSKNDIAWRLVNAMPKAETFVDMFCGGCAATHAAIVSGRWQRFIINDVKPTADLFIRAINGDLGEYERFVSRKQFNESNDIAVKILWSFGNDMRSYLWSEDKERLKGAAVMMLTGKTLKDRIKSWLAFMKELKQSLQRLPRLQRLESLQRLQSLQRLESLQSLQSLQRLQSLQSLQRLQSLQSLQSLESHPRLELHCGDYRDVKIPDNSVVYCDIPYKGTKGYGVDFDHEDFYRWFQKLNVPAFMSEYHAPFTCVAEWPKIKKAGNPKTMKDNSMGSCTERLYFNGTMDEYRKFMIKA